MSNPVSLSGDDVKAAPTFPFPVWTIPASDQIPDSPPTPHHRPPGGPLPLYDIEYPAKVQSMDRALETLGGIGSISKQLVADIVATYPKLLPNKKSPNVTPNAQPAIQPSLELRFRPQDPFCHPINGDFRDTCTLLVEVKRKRRKRRAREVHVAQNMGDKSEERNPWVTSSRIVSFVPRTVRFREMADFQYSPDLGWNIAALNKAMRNLDVVSIESLGNLSDSLNMHFASSYPTNVSPVIPGRPSPPEPWPPGEAHGDLPINPAEVLRQYPPPIFSWTKVPLPYGYKHSGAAQMKEVIKEDGTKEVRLVNKALPPRINARSFDPTSPLGEVPDAPPEKLLQVARANRVEVPPEALRSIRAVFDVRPVCTRMVVRSLLGTVPPVDYPATSWKPKEDHRRKLKILLPIVAYYMQTGPWNGCWVRYGYDPRQHREARVWQTVELRLGAAATSLMGRIRGARFVGVVQHGSNREGSVIPVDVDAEDQPLKPLRDHIFDGTTRDGKIGTATFQLCDLEEEGLRSLVIDDTKVKPFCDNGWYLDTHFDRIRQTLKSKVIQATGAPDRTLPADATAALDPDESDVEEPINVDLEHRVRKRRNAKKHGYRRVKDKPYHVNSDHLHSEQELPDARALRAAEDLEKAAATPSWQGGEPGSSSAWPGEEDSGDYYDQVFGDDEGDSDEAPDDDLQSDPETGDEYDFDR
ncbi:tau 95 subunit of transcription factor TFIIIC [Gonapodya sp. JEL0774]|nr:tau 95 subunit of transcription factor TFIIIC [Gonapodya sp. JEL0774]